MRSCLRPLFFCAKMCLSERIWSSEKRIIINVIKQWRINVFVCYCHITTYYLRQFNGLIAIMHKNYYPKHDMEQKGAGWYDLAIPRGQRQPEGMSATWGIKNNRRKISSRTDPWQLNIHSSDTSLYGRETASRRKHARLSPQGASGKHGLSKCRFAAGGAMKRTGIMVLLSSYSPSADCAAGNRGSSGRSPEGWDSHGAVAVGRLVISQNGYIHSQGGVEDKYREDSY